MTNPKKPKENLRVVSDHVKIMFYMRYLPVSRRPVCRENVVSDGCDSCVDSIANSSWQKKKSRIIDFTPFPKKIVFTEKKKHSKDRGLRLPCQNQETVSHMQLQKGNHWWLLQIYPQQCPTAGHCPPWSLGCFPRKNGSVNQLDEMWWFYKSLHGNLRAPPPQCQPPPGGK